MDPLAEEDPNWTPYRFCYNNPIKYIDPDGLHEYTLDKEGNINLAKETKDKFDVIYTTKDYNDKKENGYKVNKNSVNDEDAILHKLSKKESHGQFKDGIRWADSKDSKTMKGLFEFVANNSDVEWTLSVYTNGSVLGTGHDTDRTLSEFGNGKYDVLNLKEHYHSHPCIANAGDKCDKASGYGTKEQKEILDKGFQPRQFGDLLSAGNTYNKFIKAGKIKVENGYKGAPKFYIYRTFTGEDRGKSKPFYFEYDPWTKRK